VYPVVLGKGKSIFESVTVPAALRVIDSVVFPERQASDSTSRPPASPSSGTSATPRKRSAAWP